jgi:hypothetical protein
VDWSFFEHSGIQPKTADFVEHVFTADLISLFSFEKNHLIFEGGVGM